MASSHQINIFLCKIKFVLSFCLQDHSRFVQAVRYSPSGNLFASAGFDGKVFLYDGTTADLISEMGAPAHKGGVYGVRIVVNLVQMD